MLETQERLYGAVKRGTGSKGLALSLLTPKEFPDAPLDPVH